MRQDKVGAYSSAADRGTGVPGCVLGSTASRVIARDLELGQREGLGIVEYYGVGCSGDLPPLVIFPQKIETNFKFPTSVGRPLDVCWTSVVTPARGGRRTSMRTSRRATAD